MSDRMGPGTVPVEGRRARLAGPLSRLRPPRRRLVPFGGEARMLRAARFAAKLGFTLHPETEAPLHKLAYLLDGELVVEAVFEPTCKPPR